MMKKILLVYFSGTGGTKLVADQFEDSFTESGCQVIKHSLDLQVFKNNRDHYPEIVQEIDQIILIYAVHAMDAPEPVYEWIQAMPKDGKIPIAVISISGGGEIWPNTSCRVAVINALEAKGYPVPYENMMVMPSNWITPGDEHVVMHLLNKMPQKVMAIVAAVQAGEKRRSGFKLSTRILMPLSNIEKKQAKVFGNKLKVLEQCNGCGWCEKNCPRENIFIKDKTPVFANSCIMCLRCIYGCPKKAIFAKRASFVVIKRGFDLKAVKEKMGTVVLSPVDECCKGLVWLGVKRYLKEKC